jgi:hypothetical protein
MLATIRDFTLISMSGATSAQGGHPLYETARKLQDLRLVSSLSHNRLRRKRSNEFVNEGRINPTIWIDSRLTNRLRLSSLEEAHNARGVAKRYHYQSPEFERASQAPEAIEIIGEQPWKWKGFSPHNRRINRLMNYFEPRSWTNEKASWPISQYATLQPRVGKRGVREDTSYRYSRCIASYAAESKFPWILLSGRTNCQAVSLQDR